MSEEKKEFDPKEALEARKAEMAEITTKLENGVKNIFEGKQYKAYLDFCAKLPRYSVNNQILIMMQRPDATMCQSFGGWKDVNRFVKRGEKGIRILAPAPYKTEREVEKTDANGKVILDANGEPVKEKVEVTVNAFKPVSTFDISQTEGDPIPIFCANELTGDVEGFNKLMDAIREVIHIPIEFEDIKSDAKGYFNIEENRIAVKSGMSEVQTLKTVIHESAHYLLHSKDAMKDTSKSANQKETEAESVAYVVCKHYGIDTDDYSFGYVASWSADKEVPELKASLDTIRRTSCQLIVGIDEIVQNHDQNLEEFKDIEARIDELSEEMPFDPPKKKESVMEKLKEGKDKASKTKVIDKPKKKELQEAI